MNRLNKIKLMLDNRTAREINNADPFDTEEFKYTAKKYVDDEAALKACLRFLYNITWVSAQRY